MVRHVPVEIALMEAVDRNQQNVPSDSSSVRFWAFGKDTGRRAERTRDEKTERGFFKGHGVLLTFGDAPMLNGVNCTIVYESAAERSHCCARPLSIGRCQMIGHKPFIVE